MDLSARQVKELARLIRHEHNVGVKIVEIKVEEEDAIEISINGELVATVMK